MFIGVAGGCGDMQRFWNANNNHLFPSLDNDILRLASGPMLQCFVGIFVWVRDIRAVGVEGWTVFCGVVVMVGT